MSAASVHGAAETLDVDSCVLFVSLKNTLGASFIWRHFNTRSFEVKGFSQQ